MRVCCGRGGHFSFVGPPNYAACLRRLPSPNIYTQDARVLHPHRDMTVFTNSIFFFSFYRWSVGSVLFLLSWAVLMGPWTYARHLVSGPRLPFTAAYFGSIALTLYFAIGVSNFCLFSAICFICSVRRLLLVGFWSRPLESPCRSFSPSARMLQITLPRSLLALLSYSYDGCTACLGGRRAKRKRILVYFAVRRDIPVTSMVESHRLRLARLDLKDRIKIIRDGSELDTS